VQKALCKAKCEADNLCQQHLEKLLNQAVAANQGKKYKALKYLIWAECNQQCYVHFCSHTKPKSSGGLAFVTVCDANGMQQLLLQHEDIEDTLLKYSRTHFAKAEGSLFMQAPLHHLLQYDGITPFGESIFQGHPPPMHHNFDDQTRAILQHMHCKLPTHHQPPHHLDYELLMNGIKKWPEHTMTSPSGCHLGIYKMLQMHVLRKKKDNQPKMELMADNVPPGLIKQSRDILYLIFNIMSIAIKHTYPLQ